jgi:hypothetical protein
VPDVEHGHSDAANLARKLHKLESELTANERRLLKRIMAAAVLSGIVLGVANTAGDAAAGPVDSAGSGTAAPQAAEGMDSLRAQFVDAFTPGEEWTTAATDIGLVH